MKTETLSQITHASIEGVQKLAKGSIEATQGTAKLLYEHGRMHLHTSNNPSFIYPTHAHNILDHLRTPNPEKHQPSISVSLPFKLGNKQIPAITNEQILKIYDPNFPRAILSLEDPSDEIKGDETLTLRIEGNTENVDTKPFHWKIWFPGNFEIGIANPKEGNGSTINIPAIELTSWDVAQFISQSLQKNTKNLTINPTKILSGINLISTKTTVLKERWELLQERLEFSQNLLQNPLLAVTILRGIITAPTEEFAQLMEKMENGEIQNWSGFIRELNNFQNAEIGNAQTGTIPFQLLSAGKVRPEKIISESTSPVTTPMLVNFLGIRYFNSLYRGYRDRIVPVMEQIAETIIDNQEASLKYTQALLNTRGEAMREALKELKRQEPALYGGIEAAVRVSMKQLKIELDSLVKGDAPNIKLPNHTQKQKAPSLTELKNTPSVNE